MRRIDSASGVGGQRLSELAVGEKVGAVVAGLLEACGECGVGRGVADVAGAQPLAELAVGGGAFESGFAHAEKFVAMRYEAKADGVAMQGGFFGTRLAGALGCCFEVEAGVKTIFQSEHGRGNRGVGDADLVGKNGVDALGSGGDLTANLKADELEVGGDVAELHLDAIFAEFLVEVDAFRGGTLWAEREPRWLAGSVR